MAVAALGLAGCNIVHKPDINGSDHQPMMHGWTYEQAGEYWLQAALDEERGNVSFEGRPWMTPEALASIDDENIQVDLPLAPKGTNPQPRNGTTYRQAENDGFVTFHLMGQTQLAADTMLAGTLKYEKLTLGQMMTIGKADVRLQEPMYDSQDTTLTCYVQQRGRGIYTLYYITNYGTNAYPQGTFTSIAAVIAVHPGSDSLTICRGNTIGPAYIAEK